MSNSSAVNSTQHLQCSITYEIYSFVQPVFSVASSIGNILIILCVYKTPALRNSINLHIVNMAISDLLYIFVSGPLLYSKSLANLGSTTGILLCRIFSPAKLLAQFVSVASLVLISVDRYIAIVKPLRAKKITTRMRAALVLLTWLLGGVILVPLVYYFRYPCGLMCVRTNVAVTIYGRVIFTMYYFVPLTLITILYSRMLKTLKRQPRPGNDLQGYANLRRLQQHKNIMKILISIVSAFFICWTPFTANMLGYLSVPLIDFLNFSRDTCFGVNILANLFCPLLSTGINPTILFILGSKYHKALKKLFSCFVCKLRPGSKAVYVFQH